MPKGNGQGKKGKGCGKSHRKLNFEDDCDAMHSDDPNNECKQNSRSTSESTQKRKVSSESKTNKQERKKQRQSFVSTFQEDGVEFEIEVEGQQTEFNSKDDEVMPPPLQIQDTTQSVGHDELSGENVLGANNSATLDKARPIDDDQMSEVYIK